MTVSNPVNIATHTGNNSATSFPYTFLIPEGTAVVTLTTLATGFEGDPLVEGVDYSISGEDDPAGGAIVYPLSGSPLSTDYKINIRRIMPIEQTLNLTNQSGFNPEVLEEALDYIIFILEQHEEKLDRTFFVGAGASLSAEEFIDAITGATTDIQALVTQAEAARDATLAAYDTFDDRYLGSQASDPTLDNDGNALVAGSLYFNSVAGEMRLYTGSAWVAAYVSGDLGSLITGVAAKTTLVDADLMPLADSADSNAGKKITVANFKSVIWTALGALISGGTDKATPVDADMFAIADSAASNATKKVTLTNLKAVLKTYFDTLYEALGAATAWTYQTSTPVADTDWVTFTGLSAYRTVEFSVHFGSAAGITPGIEARVSGGTWRVIDSSLVNVVDPNDQFAIVGRIDNFNQAAPKNVEIRAGTSTATLDASSAVNTISLSSDQHIHVAYSEVWDELRFGDATVGIEGGTVDQRGIAIVKGM